LLAVTLKVWLWSTVSSPPGMVHTLPCTLPRPAAPKQGRPSSRTQSKLKTKGSVLNRSSGSNESAALSTIVAAALKSPLGPRRRASSGEPRARSWTVTVEACAAAPAM
jgi:hypothetical protein